MKIVITTFLLVAALVSSSCSNSGGDDGSPSGDGDSTGATDDPPVVTDDDPPIDVPVTYPTCAAQPFPASCGPAAVDAPTGYGANGTFDVLVETMKNPNAGSPKPLTIYRPDTDGKVPVIFFSHAFGATNADVYDVLFRELASNGFAVVHAAYATLNVTNAARYAMLWDGFTAAATAYADTFDLARVGYAGHSFGGGATPEIARLGSNQGWGTSGRFMFIMAPWYSWGSDYASIPADTKTVIQVYADDATNDHQIAVNDIWNELPAGIDRGWLLISSDACDCGLNADHVVPMSAAQTSDPQERNNGLDTWGVSRRLHALADYALNNESGARGIAYGEETAMGHWIGCEGRAVRPLEAATTPLVTTCVADLEYPYAARCDNADEDYPCP